MDDTKRRGYLPILAALIAAVALALVPSRSQAGIRLSYDPDPAEYGIKPGACSMMICAGNQCASSGGWFMDCLEKYSWSLPEMIQKVHCQDFPCKL